MATIFKKINKEDSKLNTVYILDKQSDVSKLNLDSKQKKYATATFKDDGSLVELNMYDRHVFIVYVQEKNSDKLIEKHRVLGSQICDVINKAKGAGVQVVGASAAKVAGVAEGIALTNYQFLKYFKDKAKRSNSLKKIALVCKDIKSKEVNNLEAVTQAVCHARDLVNEPLSYLTATALAKEIKLLGKAAKFKVEVFDKKKIESLKMGGLLAVNKGSVDPPTFTVMEWKPKNAKNKKPIILVGKGVVYDTGGLSLKPTANSMDLMKSDMGGSAMMAGAMYAIAKAELPMHVIGLIPATDNRPGLNAYAPGDVVKMHNGMTVEVLNTDAEGRMLLADALSFAKKYDPELVIDSATLTGAAIRAIGTKASCVMGTATDKDFEKLEQSGFSTHERVVRMPFWDDFGELIKSDIADIKNLGGPYAGHITAGKFLEHFTDYPWIHIDIAGPAFLNAKDAYRSKWATGVGVRLLFDFLSKR
ncbi:MAG: leucyl aminopeptidase [Patiriisocius sp.]|jgi:leucyl aminopeptidase